MKVFDPTLASPFHLEWLVPLDTVTEDDYTRAVAEKADTILRSARFVEMHAFEGGTDLEVRLWVEAACGNACVSVTWEPGVGLFGFHLLDETLRERLACVVFDDVPCVTASESEAQADLILEAALRAVAETEDGADLDEIADRVRDAQRSVRVPVVEPRRPPADPGVEP